MRVDGQRVRSTRLVQRGRYVVAIDIEMVIPSEDPSEPCLEAETVNLLREVAEHADRGDLQWLKQHGKVYKLVDVA